MPPEPPAVVQRRDLLLAGGNPWYTALLYGIGDETKARSPLCCSLGGSMAVQSQPAAGCACN